MTEHHAPVEVEPRTPVWLTVFGALLLLVIAIWWLAPSRTPDATIRVPAATTGGAAVEEGGQQPAPEAPTIRVPAIREGRRPETGDGAMPRIRPSLKVPRLPPTPPSE